MADPREEWVLVRDINELSPGVAVELRPCGACNKLERHTIKTSPQKYPVHSDGEFFDFIGVETVDGGCLAAKPGTRPGIPDFRVKDGTVWRLVLREPDATESTAAQRPKQRVREGAGRRAR